MKNIVLLILFLVTLFIINIFFYYNSNYYQNFIKGLKGDESFLVEEANEQDIEEKIGSIREELLAKEETFYEPQNEALEQEVPDPVVPQTEIQLGKRYREIVDAFSDFKLDELAINTKLFDLTNEYPDAYFEYYSRDLSLYIFPTKNYDEVLDIFTVLEDELPFTVNVTNNFGEATFYINLNEDIADSTVRMVVKSENRVFGLKIKNNVYNEVKSILSNL